MIDPKLADAFSTKRTTDPTPTEAELADDRARRRALWMLAGICAMYGALAYWALR